MTANTAANVLMHHVLLLRGRIFHLAMSERGLPAVTQS